jgi:hypothetical protein
MVSLGSPTRSRPTPPRPRAVGVVASGLIVIGALIIGITLWALIGWGFANTINNLDDGMSLWEGMTLAALITLCARTYPKR